MIAVWATIGNLSYNTSYLGNDPNASHYDWLFLTGTTFSFIPPYLMPLASMAAIFGVVMCLYGIYYLYMHLYNKRAAKKNETEISEEKAECTV
jgi:Ca2+/Na+ antiporter